MVQQPKRSPTHTPQTVHHVRLVFPRRHPLHSLSEWRIYPFSISISRAVYLFRPFRQSWLLGKLLALVCYLYVFSVLFFFFYSLHPQGLEMAASKKAARREQANQAKPKRAAKKKGKLLLCSFLENGSLSLLPYTAWLLYCCILLRPSPSTPFPSVRSLCRRSKPDSVVKINRINIFRLARWRRLVPTLVEVSRFEEGQTILLLLPGFCPFFLACHSSVLSIMVFGKFQQPKQSDELHTFLLCVCVL